MNAPEVQPTVKIPDRPPVLFPLEELPEEAGYIEVIKKEFTALGRRAHPMAIILMQFIDSRTRSAPLLYNGKRPTHATIPMVDFQRLTGASDRTISAHLSRLEKWQFIERQISTNGTHKGGYRTLPHNYRKREIPQPKPHRVRTKPLEAHVSGPNYQAAMRAPARGQEAIKGQSFPLQFSVSEAIIGRRITLALSERGELPSIAEIKEIQALAEQQAAQPAAESTLVREIAVAAGSSGLPNRDKELQVNLQGTAEVLPLVGVTSATCCPYGWLCPVFDGPSATPPVQKQKQNQSVGGCVTGEATEGTHPPTSEPALPATTPEETELEAIAAAIPEKLTEKLVKVPDRELLLSVRAELAGTPPEWLTRKIYQRFQSITSLGLLIRPDGGLAADARKAYQKWLAEHAPAPIAKPAAVSTCDQCHGSGFPGLNCNSLGEAKQFVESGARPCTCEFGKYWTAMLE